MVNVNTVTNSFNGVWSSVHLAEAADNYVLPEGIYYHVKVSKIHWMHFGKENDRQKALVNTAALFVRK